MPTVRGSCSSSIASASEVRSSTIVLNRLDIFGFSSPGGS